MVYTLSQIFQKLFYFEKNASKQIMEVDLMLQIPSINLGCILLWK